MQPGRSTPLERFRGRRGWGIDSPSRPSPWGVDGMGSFFRLMAAGPLFFFSSWLAMIFAGILADDVGIHPFGYPTAMVFTIGLWLALAPAMGAIASTRKGSR